MKTLKVGIMSYEDMKRKTASLSRTLKSMAGYGLISLQKRPGGKRRPKVEYSDVVLDLPIARKQQHAAA